MKKWTKGKVYAQVRKTKLVAVIRAVKKSGVSPPFSGRFLGIELWYFDKTLSKLGVEVPYLWDADYHMVKAPPIVLALCGISLDDKY